MNTFGEYGMEGPGSEGVMHAQLTTPDGFTIMASDMPPGQEDGHSPGNNITVSISGEERRCAATGTASPTARRS